MKKIEPSGAFERAMWDALRDDFSDVPEEAEIDHDFSPTFEQKIDRLCRSTQKRTWRYVNTTAKRVLIAAVLFVLLAMTVVATVPALREGLIKIFTHDTGVAYTFEFTEEDLARAPESIETVFLPTYIPEGYEYIGGDIAESISQVNYSDNYYLISYKQFAIWDMDPITNDDPSIPTVLGIDSEGAVTEDLVVNGYEVRAIHYDPEEEANPTVYLWTDQQYLYYLGIQNTAEYGLDEFSKIQASLVGRPITDYIEPLE